MDQLVLDLDLSADGLSSGGMHFRDVHRADRRDRHSVLEEANVVWEQNRAVSQVCSSCLHRQMSRVRPPKPRTSSDWLQEFLRDRSRA
jgi:hypothetical protein